MDTPQPSDYDSIWPMVIFLVIIFVLFFVVMILQRRKYAQQKATYPEQVENDMSIKLWVKVWLVIAFLILVSFSFLPYIGTSTREWTLWQFTFDTRSFKNAYGLNLLNSLPAILGIILIFCGLLRTLIKNSRKHTGTLLFGILFTLLYTFCDAVGTAPGWHIGLFSDTFFPKIGMWLSLGASFLLITPLIIDGQILKGKSRKDSTGKEKTPSS